MVNTPPTPLVDAMAFAQRFINLRKQADFTQDALAEAVGVHISQIHRYEAGTSNPTLDVLRNIALALHTSADSLVFDPDERQPTDDLTLIFEAINDLDPHHQQLAKELLEAITHRAHAHRWQQQPASRGSARRRVDRPAPHLRRSGETVDRSLGFVASVDTASPVDPVHLIEELDN